MIRSENVAVRKLNKVFAIVSLGGYLRIIRKEPFKFVSKKEIIKEYGDQGRIWLGSENRETYKYGIGVYPKGCREEIYNLWQPPKAKEGECGLFIDYIRDSICSSKKLRFNWLMDWLADLIQNPTNPKGCGIVINGSEGLLEDVIEEIYKTHTNTQIDSIVVRSDKGSTELLEAYHLVSNWIGVTGLLVKNMTHQIISSDWRPSTKGKWLILEQTDTDSDKVRDELESGGIKAFVYYLSQREITSNLSKAPKTPGKPKPERVTNVPAWWEYAVEYNDMPVDAINKSLEWPKHVIAAELYDKYGDWCQKTGEKPESSMIFSIEMIKHTKIKRMRLCHKKLRRRLYVIPTRNRCKKRILNESKLR